MEGGRNSRVGDSTAIEDLVATLWDDDARVRLKAAWALGKTGDERAVAPLKRLYRMENEGGREIIREAREAIRNRAGSERRERACKLPSPEVSSITGLLACAVYTG